LNHTLKIIILYFIYFIIFLKKSVDQVSIFIILLVQHLVYLFDLLFI